MRVGGLLIRYRANSGADSLNSTNPGLGEAASRFLVRGTLTSGSRHLTSSIDSFANWKILAWKVNCLRKKFT